MDLLSDVNQGTLHQQKLHTGGWSENYLSDAELTGKFNGSSHKFLLKKRSVVIGSSNGN